MKKIISSLFVTSLMIAGVSAAYEKNIVDVTSGEEIRGITTSADAAGYAKAMYAEGEYILHAELEGLTDPIWDDFYEGWVVRQSPFAFISTGELEKKDGKYTNHYTSSIDYTDYDFYVLTLEPNDGNDAPADHILEGDVVTWKMMMKDDNTMMKDSVMKKEKMMNSGIMKALTPRQEILKKWIKQRLASIDSSNLNTEVIYTKIQMVRDTIDKRWFSDAKKMRYLELLDILEVAIWEVTTMSQ